MTWKTFIGAIDDSGLTKDSPPKIVINLFVAAGRMEGFTESTAKSWINGNRKCKVSTYFPNGKLEDESGALRFFRSRPENKLKRLQQIFCEINDKDSPINLETDDMDIFCWSLRNQFLDLLGFERLDNPASIGESTDDNQNAVSTQNVIIDQEIIVSDNDEAGDTSTNIEHEADSSIDNGGAQIHLPPEYSSDKYRRCVFCTHWKGNTIHAYKTKTGVYGTCMMYNNSKQLSTGGTDCKEYEADCIRIESRIPMDKMLSIFSK